jgi:hypothetical protein
MMSTGQAAGVNIGVDMGVKMTKTKRRRSSGRPTKISDAIQRKMVELLRAGNYYETAAASCGVRAVTERNWRYVGKNAEDAMAAGKDVTAHERRCARYLAAVEKARAEAEATALSSIALAGAEGQWQANAWRLERMYPEKYGKRLAVQAEVKTSVVALYPLDGDNVSSTLVLEGGDDE